MRKIEQEWISLNEFMRRNKIGYSTAIRLINSGKVECQKLNEQYKIKVSKDEKANKMMEGLIRENEELRTYIKSIKALTNQIKV